MMMTGEGSVMITNESVNSRAMRNATVMMSLSILSIRLDSVPVLFALARKSSIAFNSKT